MPRHEELREVEGGADQGAVESVPETLTEATEAIAKRIQHLIDSSTEESAWLALEDEEVAEEIAHALRAMILECGGSADDIDVRVEREAGRMANISAHEGVDTYAVYADGKFIAQIIDDDGEMRVVPYSAFGPPRLQQDIRQWLTERVPAFQEEARQQEQKRAQAEQAQARAVERAEQDAQKAESVIAELRQEEVVARPTEEPMVAPAAPASEPAPRTLFKRISDWFGGKG